jgi:hypothetical protein
MWLRGVSERKIAEAVGFARATVRYHLDRTIFPQWRDTMRSRLAEDLAKVALIERTAWERFDNAGPEETRETVEKALLEGGRKPRLVKQVVSKVTRTGEIAWMQVIQWCLEFRARVHAHYAPRQRRVATEGELRVAGKTPSEVDQEMLKRLEEKVEERRRYEEGMDFGRN